MTMLFGRRRVLAAGSFLGLLLVLLPATVFAHPLGNFTINHYAGIRVTPDAIFIDRVLDMAEIPTFSERAAMDTDQDGQVTPAEASAYEASRCDTTRTALDLERDGQRLMLDVTATGLSFPMGQGAVTLRLICEYSAPLMPALATGGQTFTFQDTAFAERRGWREIVVQGDGTTVRDSDAATSGASARLTRYPTDLLATPSDERSASWTARPGGVTLPPLQVPDATPVGATVAPVPQPDAGRPLTPQPVTPAAPALPASAAVPGGISELGGDIGALFQTADLTPTVMLLSLLVAAGLGAWHALTPGHGKTVMAAYLVGSRGSARHALGLGVTVTVSHTIGVVALGLLSLSAAALIPPERLYPILGIVSGAIVVAIGVWLIAGRVRSIRRERAETRAHAAAHASGLEHEKDHGHEHEHQHDEEAAGWHGHGSLRHTHVPGNGATLSWRGLFALGLAGGMVPSVSALILLLGSVAAGRPAWGIVLTVAFGIGMAIVLVGVGVGLVYARGFVERFQSGGSSARLMRLLPTATAFVVLFAGLLLTTQAVMTFR